MSPKTRPIILATMLAMFAILSSCGDPFEPASLIQSRRVLAITLDPLEASPGETVVVGAVVTNADGSLYEGPIAWGVATGDALRLEGAFLTAEDPVRLPASEPFTWQVPAREDLAELYGEWETRGVLLTIGASAFKSASLFTGELIGKTIPAFKLLVVSENEPNDRWENPRLEEIAVETPDGVRLTSGPDGIFSTTASKVILRAMADADSDRLTYSWFATDEDFEPDEKGAQRLEPARKGSKIVYCVLRETHFFDHDDGTRTRVAGIDWKRIVVRFE